MDLQLTNYFSTSISYYNDDLTWCISRAKPFPVWLNMWRVGSLICWILGFLIVYLNGTVVFFLLKYEKDHQGFMKKDLHYTILQMALPTFTGTAQNMSYRPKSIILMIYIGIMLSTGILISIAWNCFLVKALSHPFQGTQINTISQIINDDFRFVGEQLAHTKIVQQPLV